MVSQGLPRIREWGVMGTVCDVIEEEPLGRRIGSS